ncbi:MAG TPA: NAD(P)(+) transhydrogenase (Re/Si-specific) subunit beta [Myxococcota bacterium]|nr:NAD(P)(+) transhydrogenase (Re/Si-specific) subunit beta [Myxococcota bacterium]
MTPGGLTLLYLVAATLFILSLGGLSRQETARQGNRLGVVGMGVALLATLLHPDAGRHVLAVLAVSVGGVIGLRQAQRVAMTEMPEMVAVLHSFVGLAAVLVGISTYLDPGAVREGAHAVIHTLEVYVDVTIGAVTFAGSIVAWAKLNGKVSGKPLLLPARHRINAIAALVLLLAAVPTVLLGWGVVFLLFATVLAAALGAHLVLAIGGADMPVVVSLLNSYSGWTAAAAGFMLSNDLLIITGALVGSSGAILSYIMCRAMNRSIWNVVFGGFGTEGGTVSASAEQGEVQAIDTEGLDLLLQEANDIVIVPGYGLAVARAQNAVRAFVDAMERRGKRVRFAIHPVAGRLPGHMNVLLAEAGVSYDIVHEMEEINGEIPHSDVALIIGANDIVNPGAQTDPGSPIYGMPVLEVWKARTCVVLKRGMASGYAGVENPLFFCENTRMLFGDARQRMEEVVARVA